MKSILIILPTLDSGGAEKVNILIANYLHTFYNYKITFFVFDNSVFYKELISSEINILQESIPIKNFGAIKRWYYYYYKYGVILAKKIDHIEYDIIIAGYERLSEIAIINFIFKNWKHRNAIKRKIVSIIHVSLKSIEKKSSLRAKAILQILNFLRPFFFKKIIAVSNSVKCELENIYGYKNITTINEPIICKDILKEASINPTCNPTNKYFLNIGRISFQKNQLFLVKAFDKIKHLVNHNLIIVGAIQEQKIHDSIKKLIKERNLEDRVLLANPSINPFPYIKGSSAFVFSSIYEGFGIVLVESMILKIPIISTKFIGYENILNENNSILVDENDVNSFANYMLQVANREYDYSSKVNTAYDFAQNFDISVIGEKYREYFESM